MKNKFFLNSLGVAAIIFALAFLIRSVGTANATPPKPNEFIDEGGNNGKYQMQMTDGVDGTGVFYYNALIWDTSTGKSTMYQWDRDKQVWAVFFGGKDAVPNLVQ